MKTDDEILKEVLDKNELNRMTEGEFKIYDKGSFLDRKIKKAIKEAIALTREDERKNQYDGICTNCNKPDKFSKSTLCGDCIKRWKEKLEIKAMEDERKRILELIDEKLKLLKKEHKPTINPQTKEEYHYACEWHDGAIEVLEKIKQEIREGKINR